MVNRLITSSFFGFLCLVATLTAQTTSFEQLREQLWGIQDMMRIDALNGGFTQPDVKGSPFLFTGWTPAVLKIKDREELIADISVNINQEKYQVLIRMPDGSAGELNTARVHWLEIQTPAGRRMFRVLAPAYLGEAEGPEKFYEILYEGKFSLIKRYTKLFRKGKGAEAYGGVERNDEYIDQESYYIRPPEGVFRQVGNLKAKTVEKALPDYIEAIRRIARERNLDLSEEAQVVALLQALEQGEGK